MARRFLFILFVVSMMHAAPAAAWDLRKQEVDVALVLAADVSPSISDYRWQLQLRGYADAFRSPEVLYAIMGGSIGAIVVTFVEWSGTQFQMTDWHLINSIPSGYAFAAKLDRLEHMKEYNTHIDAAIDFSARLFEGAPFVAMRKVIDISGDGKDNQGRPFGEARDAAVRSGIVINGLPIIADEPDVAMFYAAYVIGGNGSFLSVVHKPDDFGKAIKKKLLREIAMR